MLTSLRPCGSGKDKDSVQSRAYITFRTADALVAFSRGYDGWSFRDKAGAPARPAFFRTILTVRRLLQATSVRRSSSSRRTSGCRQLQPKRILARVQSTTVSELCVTLSTSKLTLDHPAPDPDFLAFQEALAAAPAAPQPAETRSSTLDCFLRSLRLTSSLYSCCEPEVNAAPRIPPPAESRLQSLAEAGSRRNQGERTHRPPWRDEGSACDCGARWSSSVGGEGREGRKEGQGEGEEGKGQVEGVEPERDACSRRSGFGQWRSERRERLETADSTCVCGRRTSESARSAHPLPARLGRRAAATSATQCRSSGPAGPTAAPAAASRRSAATASRATAATASTDSDSLAPTADSAQPRSPDAASRLSCTACDVPEHTCGPASSTAARSRQYGSSDSCGRSWRSTGTRPRRRTRRRQ